MLAAARIVKMVAGKWRAPVGENADKLASGNKWLHMSFRQVSKTKASERSLQPARPLMVVMHLVITVAGIATQLRIPQQLAGVQDVCGGQMVFEVSFAKLALRHGDGHC